MYADMRSELLHFAENTSIKGIPRLMKTKNPFLKVAWCAFVLFSFMILLYLLILNIRKYGRNAIATENPIATNWLAQNILFFSCFFFFLEKLVAGSTTFPDITVCNLDPFSVGYPKVLPIENYFEFLKKNKIKIKECLMKKPNDQYLNFDCPDFILSCHVYFNNWFENKVKCPKSFRKRWNKNYYTCHTLQTNKLKSENNDKSIKGLKLLLNVGPVNLMQIPYRYSFIRSQERGVQFIDLLIYNKITFLTSVRFGCNDETITRFFPNEIYTRETCIEFCRQDIIYKETGCVSHYLDVPLKYLDTADVCENFSLYSTESKKFQLNSPILNYSVLDKSYDSLKYVEYNCNPSCPHRCHESIYQKYSYLNQSFLDDLKYNNTTTSSVLAQIQESFLMIKFIIKEEVPFFDVEEAAYTWDTMVGVIEGMFSFWLGVSVATAIELLELGYRLMKSFYRNCVARRKVAFESFERAGDAVKSVEDGTAAND
ncbi:hypothetical protein HELRODRAFT_167079 [Helobdella robusta]|uniref:Uncharacterized protein n=1 Tax=Helobdella robusta TaxID=6412 RepID=T1EYZ8_HELRO|nr:hypothetical protein HELRODRAFT_167079 [Helobdella robusta]ESO10577.1 hypothetical protein HELRODRAFT_167079 [Helobdella robusta]